MISPQDVLNFAISYRCYHECVEGRKDGGIAVWGQDLLEMAERFGIKASQMPTLVALPRVIEGAKRRLAEQKAAEEAEQARQNSVRNQLRLITGGAA